MSERQGARQAVADDARERRARIGDPQRAARRTAVCDKILPAATAKGKAERQAAAMAIAGGRGGVLPVEGAALEQHRRDRAGQNRQGDARRGLDQEGISRGARFWLLQDGSRPSGLDPPGELRQQHGRHDRRNESARQVGDALRIEQPRHAGRPERGHLHPGDHEDLGGASGRDPGRGPERPNSLKAGERSGQPKARSPARRAAPAMMASCTRPARLSDPARMAALRSAARSACRTPRSTRIMTRPGTQAVKAAAAKRPPALRAAPRSAARTAPTASGQDRRTYCAARATASSRPARPGARATISGPAAITHESGCAEEDRAERQEGVAGEPRGLGGAQAGEGRHEGRVQPSLGHHAADEVEEPEGRQERIRHRSGAEGLREQDVPREADEARADRGGARR